MIQNMPKLLVRIASLLLVLCLVADPALAACPTTYSSLPSCFSEQALAEPPFSAAGRHASKSVVLRMGAVLALAVILSPVVMAQAPSHLELDNLLTSSDGVDLALIYAETRKDYEPALARYLEDAQMISASKRRYVDAASYGLLRDTYDEPIARRLVHGILIRALQDLDREPTTNPQVHARLLFESLRIMINKGPIEKRPLKRRVMREVASDTVSKISTAAEAACLKLFWDLAERGVVHRVELPNTGAPQLPPLSTPSSGSEPSTRATTPSNNGATSVEDANKGNNVKKQESQNEGEKKETYDQARRIIEIGFFQVICVLIYLIGKLSKWIRRIRKRKVYGLSYPLPEESWSPIRLWQRTRKLSVENRLFPTSRELVIKASAKTAESAVIVQRAIFEFLIQISVLPPPRVARVLSISGRTGLILFQVVSGAILDADLNQSVETSIKEFDDVLRSNGISVDKKAIRNNFQGYVQAKFQDIIGLKKVIVTPPLVYVFQETEFYFQNRRSAKRPEGMSPIEYRKALQKFLGNIVPPESTLIVFGKRNTETEKILSEMGFRDVLPDLLEPVTYDNLQKASELINTSNREPLIVGEKVLELGGPIKVFRFQRPVPASKSRDLRVVRSS
jgi:hypothetical protein